jgi:hypothetical protein
MTDPSPPSRPFTTADGAADATAIDAEASPSVAPRAVPQQLPGEIGGPRGPEPTRFGDWEFKGRCSDF